MEHIRWTVSAAQASGGVVMGVLALQMRGLFTLPVLREVRQRIMALKGVAAAVLDFRGAVVAVGDEGLTQFSSESPSRQPMALLVDPSQHAMFLRYCDEITPRHGKLRVLFVNEAAALAWAARRAQTWAPLPPVPVPAVARSA